MTLPAAGGSYVRDPRTGALTPATEAPAAADTSVTAAVAEAEAEANAAAARRTK